MTKGSSVPICFSASTLPLPYFAENISLLSQEATWAFPKSWPSLGYHMDKTDSVSIWSVLYLFIKLRARPHLEKTTICDQHLWMCHALLGQKSSHNWRRWSGFWWHHIKSEEVQDCSFHAQTSTEMGDAVKCKKMLRPLQRGVWGKSGAV